MSEAEYREASREQWSGTARRWAEAAEEEETGASGEATRWMLAAADLQPGERTLELACGAGRVGLQAAERVGPDGTVLCSDFSEAMVEAVKGRVERLQVPNVSTEVLNAEELELEDGHFDVVLCRFGYMLMANPLQALHESSRALRPGGRLVLAVWGTADDNPWLATILGAVMDHLGAPPPEPGTPGPFALADPERLRELLAEAGLVDTEIETVETKQAYGSPELWWKEILEVSGPLATMLNALTETDRDAIRGAALSRAERFTSTEGSVVFPASVVGARARKPT